MKSLDTKIFDDLDEIITENIEDVIVDSYVMQEVLDNTYRSIWDRSAKNIRWVLVSDAQNAVKIC
jgi:hypothetical protein